MRLLFLFLLLTCRIFANVDVRTNIQDILHGDTFAEAGAITLTISGNDFSHASLENPIFIRIFLGNQATLSQTLVNIDGEGTQNLPIYLAMRIEGYSVNPPYTVMVASPETVSIIRWIKGERSIWLRIQSSSDTWLEKEGQAFGPTWVEQVAFTLGISARRSYENNYYSGSDRVNREANSRNQSDLAGEMTAVSTLLLLNAPNGNAFPAPNSTVHFGIASKILVQDILTTQKEMPIESGLLGLTSVSGDNAIARMFAKDFDINLNQAWNLAELCEAGSTQGLVFLACDKGFQITSGNNMNFYRHKLILRVPSGSQYGFQTGPLLSEYRPSITEWWGNDPTEMEQVAFFEVNGITSSTSTIVAARAYPDTEFIITPEGERLAKEVEIEISGYSTHQFEMILAMDYRSDPQLVELFGVWQVNLSGRDEWLDVAPFEQTQLYAPPHYFALPEFDWQAGSFIACPN